MIPLEARPFVQDLHHPEALEKGVKLKILRTDQIHPTISGNKYWKLKYNIQAALDQNYPAVLTMGGAYSNHIYATAAACRLAGLKSIGIIRGERVEPLNPTLQFAEAQGMQLHFISRGQYRDRDTSKFASWLMETWGSFYFIPEGGSNALAVIGCKEIAAYIPDDTDIIAVPVGTGGTMAGLIAGLPDTSILGFPVLKGGEFLCKVILDLLKASNQADSGRWELVTGYHFGGYARVNEPLKRFVQDFDSRLDCPLDMVYTGKMMYGVLDMIRNDFFPRNKNILAIHTGGMQGNLGFNQA